MLNNCEVNASESVADTEVETHLRNEINLKINLILNGSVGSLLLAYLPQPSSSTMEIL